jgi:ABC-type uncharacterized transport system substrate-binding protein
VAVIATPGFTAGALAAKTATKTIPIAFGVGDDPVKLGLVASLARPGGNATGINFFTGEVVARRLGLLHDLVPKAFRIAALVNPAQAAITESTLRDLPEAARALGLQIQVLNASSSREIEAAFAAIVRDRLDALFVPATGARRSSSSVAAHGAGAAGQASDHWLAGLRYGSGTERMDCRLCPVTAGIGVERRPQSHNRVSLGRGTQRAICRDRRRVHPA